MAELFQRQVLVEEPGMKREGLVQDVENVLLWALNGIKKL